MADIVFTGFAGLTLRGEIRGSQSDPLVLAVPGGGQTLEIWDDVAEALVKAGRCVVSLDLRGHGRSDRPAQGAYGFDAYVDDIRAVLTQLPVRPVVVAASLGGWIAAVSLGESETPLASGLVLVDTPPTIDLEKVQKLSQDARDAARADPASNLDPDYAASIDFEEVVQRFVAAAPHISVPTLYVRGEQSNQATREDAENFVESMPDAELVEVDEAGQLIAPERLDLFNAVLLEFLEKKHPRASPEYIAGSDPRILRNAMGCFATGVTVVTGIDEEGSPFGLTANSFTSVSLDPPLLLVCIARGVASCALLERASHFCVNVLHIGQQPISNTFASRVDDRFEGIEWQRGENGAPVFNNSLASIECSRQDVFDGGDHIILVGRVEKARYEPRRDPLLYFGGKYRRLHFG